MRSFRNLPGVQEVECSGSVFDPDVNIFSMALYSSADSQVLASVNLKDKECSTSAMFASCHISSRNSRHTAVRVLVLGLGADEWRKFTCEVNTLRSDGRSQIIVWSLVVQGSRKSKFSIGLFVLGKRGLPTKLCLVYKLVFACVRTLGWVCVRRDLCVCACVCVCKKAVIL